MRYHIIYDDDKEWLCGQYQRISKVEVVNANGKVVKGVR